VSDPATDTAPPRMDAAVFTNLRAAFLWLCVGGFGLALLFLVRSGMRGIVLGLLIIVALQAMISFALGVRLAKGRIGLPRAPLRQFPLLVLGRTSFPLPLLREITYSGRVLGFECIRLSTEDRSTSALFESRKRRLAFFDEIRRRHPQVKIYRS